jgi:hypothetical protein
MVRLSRVTLSRLTTSGDSYVLSRVANVPVAPIVDELRWPLVVVTMPGVALGDMAFVHFLDQLTQFCQRGQAFTLIVDVKAAPPLPPAQRRLVAERLDLHSEKYPNIMRGVAVVLSNTVQRGILNVLTWLTKRPSARTLFLCRARSFVDWSPGARTAKPGLAQGFIEKLQRKLDGAFMDALPID